MLMGPDDRRIDQHAMDLPEFRSLREEFEQQSKSARIDPAAKPLVDRQPATEFAGQIPPGNTGPGDVENRLEEQPFGEFRLLPAPRAWYLTHASAEDGPRLVVKLVSHGILPRIRCDHYRPAEVKTLTGPNYIKSNMKITVLKLNISIAILPSVNRFAV